MKKKIKDVNQELDSMKNELEWWDLVTFNYYIKGHFNMPVPVEWGRQRFERFLKKHETKDK